MYWERSCTQSSWASAIFIRCIVTSRGKWTQCVHYPNVHYGELCLIDITSDKTSALIKGVNIMTLRPVTIRPRLRASLVRLFFMVSHRKRVGVKGVMWLFDFDFEPRWANIHSQGPLISLDPLASRYLAGQSWTCLIGHVNRNFDCAYNRSCCTSLCLTNKPDDKMIGTSEDVKMKLNLLFLHFDLLSHQLYIIVLLIYLELHFCLKYGGQKKSIYICSNAVFFCDQKKNSVQHSRDVAVFRINQSHTHSQHSHVPIYRMMCSGFFFSWKEKKSLEMHVL